MRKESRNRCVVLLSIAFLFCLPHLQGAYSHRSTSVNLDPSTIEWVSISGYVNDTTMNPISGAIIKVTCGDDSYLNTSDSMGYYYVGPLPLAYCLWTISFSKEGYSTFSVEMPIVDNISYNVILTARATIFVDDTPGEGPDNPPEDFTSIQDAIDATSDGDMVFVYNGTYYENIIIDKSISIEGENKEETFIVNNNVNEVKTIIEILADNVRVSHFTVTDYHGSMVEDGVFISGSQGVIIDNILLNSTTFWWTSITLNCSKHCFILDNIIEGKYWVNEHDVDYNEFGIVCIDSVNVSIKNNVVSYHYSNGIDVCHSKNVNVSQNKVFLNGYGIVFSESSHSIIYKNDVHDGYMSSFIETSQDVLLFKNNFSFNQACGLFIGASHTIVIRKNNIFSNDEGIHLTGYMFPRDAQYCYGNTISKNNFFNNVEHAYFHSSYLNLWDANFWDDATIQPYIILGTIGPFSELSHFNIPWVNVDWHPAQEPYDIGGNQ